MTPDYSPVRKAAGNGGIPWLSSGRQTTTVKFREGQSFILHSARPLDVAVSRVPFLGELPVIDPAVNRRLTTTKKSLVVVITPEVVEAEQSSASATHLITRITIKLFQAFPK